MNRLRVAVIGAGNMGINHLRNYFLLTDVELVGVADVNPKASIIASDYKTDYFNDYKEMLNIANPDAVSIVVPTPLHFDVASDVMNRGIHCLLEKPIASTVEEADKLIKLAKDKGVVFTVGHIEHYNPIIVKIREIIKRKAIGKVTSISCRRVGGFPAKEPKTDVIIDLAVHDIDLISTIIGRQPIKLTSHGSRTFHSSKIDSAEILLDYGSASGFVQANWITPVKIRTISITGSEGYLEGNYITQELELYQHNMDKISSGNFTDFVVKMGEPRKEVIKVDFQEPLAVELKAFVDQINGETKEHLVDPVAARDALKFALQAVKPYEK